ncbi:hypothetical protein MMC10_007919 [Thelotrema lepadinum]|nr:hypothetical protein [Thelotrema lepadinum]
MVSSKAFSTTPATPTTPIPQNDNATYLSTTDAYNRWATTYDTDSNPLQALDDLQLETLLPRFIDLVLSENKRPPSTTSSTPSHHHVHIIDLGCGTGRNTVKLLPVLPKGSHVTGLDVTPNMLSLARSRCEAALKALNPTTPPDITLSFREFDIFNPIPSHNKSAQALISTLTLEHLPLAVFFDVASSILQPGGLLLLTNMHPDMGNITQAGFRDPDTGEKVRPVSYAHGLAETVREARRCEMEVVGDLLGEGDEERRKEHGGVEGSDEGVFEACNTEALIARGLLPERGRKHVEVRAWYGVVFRKSWDSLR